MAFGKKYDFQFTSEAGVVWDGEIQKKDFVGSSTTILMTGEPVLLNWRGDGNLFSLLRMSSVKLDFYSQVNFEFDEFKTADVGDYFLKLKKDGKEYWSGTFITDVFSEPYIDIPYPITLRFSCGLQELKHFKYLTGAGNLFTGNEKLLTVIFNCLNKIEPTKNIVEINNIKTSEAGWVDTESYLAQTFIRQELFIEQEKDGTDTAWDCQEVIKSICKAHGLVIMQSFDGTASGNKWHIIRVEEWDGTVLADRAFFEYNTSSTKVASGNVTFNKTITNVAGGLRWILQDQQLDINTRLNKLIYKFRTNGKFINDYNLIKNNEFDIKGFVPPETFVPPDDAAAGGLNPKQFNDEGLSWISINEPRFWSLSTNLNTQKTNMERVWFDGKRALRFNQTLLDIASADSKAGLWTYFMTSLETQGATLTFNDMEVSTTDKLLILLKVASRKVYSSLLLLKFLRFRQILMIKIGNYYLSGDITSWGDATLSWKLNPTNEFEKFVFIEYVDTTLGNNIKRYRNQFETPLLPETGTKDIEIRYVLPDFTLSPNLIYDKSWLQHFDVKYMKDGKVVKDLIISENFLQDTKVRENEKSLTVLMGVDTNISNMALGLIRKSTGRKYLDDTWGRTGDTFDKKHRFVTILNPYKELLTDFNKGLSGTLLGDYEIFNVIKSRFNDRYAILGMEYDLKSDEKIVSLHEITTTALTWNIEDNLTFLPIEAVDEETDAKLETIPNLPEIEINTNIGLQANTSFFIKIDGKFVGDDNFENYP